MRNGSLEGFLLLGGLGNEYFLITLTKVDIQEIADTADASDLVASSGLQVFDDSIGWITAHIINMFDPHVIILGGRVAELNLLYLNVPRKWPGYLLIEQSETQLLYAKNPRLHWHRARPISCKIKCRQKNYQGRVFRFR